MKKTLFKLNNSLQYCTARSILNEYHILTTHIDDMSKCLDKCCLFLNTSHTELNWLCIFTSEKCFKLKLVCFLFCLTVKSAITKKKTKCHWLADDFKMYICTYYKYFCKISFYSYENRWKVSTEKLSNI